LIADGLRDSDHGLQDLARCLRDSTHGLSGPSPYGPLHNGLVVAALLIGSLFAGAAAPAQAQTFENVVTAEPLPAAATSSDVLVADPLFYDPAGADGTLGTADDDYRGDRVAGSPLLDRAQSAFTQTAVALNGIAPTDGGPNAFDSERDIGAFESHQESLPVEWAGLSGTYLPGQDGRADDQVALRWSTLQETGNAYFQVQVRSATQASSTRPEAAGSASGNGASGNSASGNSASGGSSRWTTVARVEGAGTTTERQTYQATVAAPSGLSPAVELRLRQVDVDGRAELSDPITVRRTGLGRALQVAPNPARTAATLSLTGWSAETADVEVYDLLGRRVLRRPGIRVLQGQATVSLDAQALASGTYLVRVTAEGRAPLTVKWSVVQ